MKFATIAVFVPFLLGRTKGFLRTDLPTPIDYSDPHHLVSEVSKNIKDSGQFVRDNLDIRSDPQVLSDIFKFLEVVQHTGNFSKALNESQILNEYGRLYNISKGKIHQSENITQFLEIMSNTLQRIAKECPVDSSFPYIIPLDQSKSCDVFGPVCQTGSIAVEVSRCNIPISSTTLPCSSYLMEQSTFLFDGALNARAFSWSLAFGRSPQCHSYASAYQASGLYTLSNCGMQVVKQPSRTNSGIWPLPSQIPPAVLRSNTFDVGTMKGEVTSWLCCGDCVVDYKGVNMFYFPDDDASTYCNSKGLSISADVFSAYVTNNRTHLQAETDIDSVAVLSGYTFTSPSVYLRLEGPPSITDQCIEVITTLTDSWIAFAPGQLSTYSDTAFGKEDCLYFLTETLLNDGRFFGGGNQPTIKPLNIADLACPTWGLANQASISKNVSSIVTECLSIGPPYKPAILAPPSQISLLTPNHIEACPNGISLFNVGLPLYLIDPAIALTKRKRLTPPRDRFRKREILTTESSPTTPTTISSLLPVERLSVNTPPPTAAIIRSRPRRG